jgi:hypothetical protein
VQVTLNGTSASAILNVTTTAPHAALKKWAPFGPGGGLIFAAFLVVPFSRAKYRALLRMLLVTMLFSLVACGGGGNGGGGGGGGGGKISDPGTAAGNYSFMVTGVSGSGSNAITVSSTVAVSVQ